MIIAVLFKFLFKWKSPSFATELRLDRKRAVRRDMTDVLFPPPPMLQHFLNYFKTTLYLYYMCFKQILPAFTKYNLETHWVCCMQGCVCMLLESWRTFNLPSTASTASSSLVLSLRNSGSTMVTGFSLPTCWLCILQDSLFLCPLPFLAWNAHNSMVILNQRYFKWKRCKFDI